MRQAYDHWASTYDTDRNLTRDLDEAVTRTILGPLQCASILEIGCGTGKNTAWLAGIGRQVFAVDFSEGMLARARRRVRAHNVVFAAADVTRIWPKADQSVDLVACNLVLEHVEDLSFIFAEAFRVLTRQGRLFICELHPFRQYQGSKATYQSAGTRVEIPAFVHHLSEFVDAAQRAGFALHGFKEWWHQDDTGKPPRLVSFLFGK